MSMLAYYKMILEKVSFEPQLFEKELRKAIDELIGNELHELERWVTTRFGWQHQPLFNQR